MAGILLMCLIMFCILALVAWFTNVYSAFCYKAMVSNKLSVINEIIANEVVPPAWRMRLMERLAASAQKSNKSFRLTRWLKKWYIIRLNKSIGAIKNSPVFGDINKQEYILALEDIREYWESCQCLEDLVEKE